MTITLKYDLNNMENITFWSKQLHNLPLKCIPLSGKMKQGNWKDSLKFTSLLLFIYSKSMVRLFLKSIECLNITSFVPVYSKGFQFWDWGLQIANTQHLIDVQSSSNRIHWVFLRCNATVIWIHMRNHFFYWVSNDFDICKRIKNCVVPCGKCLDL